jgi:hypothetical protein
MVDLGKTAWKLMSKYIRTRDLGKTCITCSKVFTSIKQSDAGHLYHAAKTNQVSYDERNIHAQCSSCNRFDSGRHALYAEKVVRMYGCNVLTELLQKKKMPFKGKDKREFFYQTIADLKRKIAEQENA